MTHRAASSRRPVRRLALVPLVVLALALALGLTSCAPGGRAVDAARSVIGTTYTYGGTTPTSGFDCSGLTSWSWAQADVSLPRTSRAQHDWADPVARADLQPGDLVFYSSSGPSGTVSHVALYAGDGRIVHASSSKDQVEETSLATYWSGHLVGFGRVPASALPEG